MKVTLLFAPDHIQAVDVLYAACRQCYYPGCVGDVFPIEEVSIKEKEKLLKHVISSGHHSVLEHVSFTFSLGDITRGMAQQLTRHRIASFSMQSMRYCDTSNCDLHVPCSINQDPDACTEYLEIADSAVEFYRRYINRETNPIKKEDAREILPIGWYTSLVVTMNCRELLHFFSERLCTNAQEEIRVLAKKMLKICQERLPEIFSKAGPKCQVLGYCNEGKRSCHKAPLKSEVFNIYNMFKEKKVSNE